MTKKSKYFEPLALAVAAGATIRSAAGVAGCAEPTAYHLSSDPEFRLRVSALRSEATSAAVGRLADSASLAVDTLRSLLEPTFEPGIRLNAAKAILSTLVPLAEALEIRQRLAEVERREIERRAAFLPPLGQKHA